MFNKKVVAFCGRAGSGKSTITNLVLDHYSSSVRISFGDPLKKMLLALGLPRESLWGTPAEKEAYIPWLQCSGRHAMQTLGTEWGRELIHQNIWVQAAYHYIQAAPVDMVVIDDCRFENEYLMLLQGGAKIIGIERPGQNHTEDTHASETWDFRETGMPILLNDGTPEELFEKVKLLIE